MKRFLVLIMTLSLAACQPPGPPPPNPQGKSTTVSVKVVGLNHTDGLISLSGAFGEGQDWDNTSRKFNLSSGTGQSAAFNFKNSSGYFEFTFSLPADWHKPWYDAGQFGTNDDGWAHLGNFVVALPLDDKAHAIEVTYPEGWNTPLVTLDGATPTNLDVDQEGHLLATQRPGSDGIPQVFDSFTYDGDQLATWVRELAYRRDPSVTHSVWSYTNGKLTQVVDSRPGVTTTATYPGTAVDYFFTDTGTSRQPSTLSEAQAGRTVEAAFGAVGSETTWTALTITPSSGSPTTVTAPDGTLSLFELRNDVWARPFWDTATPATLTYTGDASDQSLKVSWGSLASDPQVQVLLNTPRLRNWTGYDTLKLIVNNAGSQAIRIQPFMQSGDDETWIYQEPADHAIPPGESTLYFDLTDLRSEATNWEFTGQGLDTITNIKDVGVAFRDIPASSSATLITLQLLNGNPDDVPLTVDSVPDANLRTILENRTGKQFGTTLTRAVAKSIEDLGFDDNRGVEDLTGLDQFSNLRSLWMNESPVDLSFVTPEHFPLLKELAIGSYNWDTRTQTQTFANVLAAYKRFSHWEVVAIGNAWWANDANWNTFYSQVLLPNKDTLREIQFFPADDASVSSFAGLNNLTNLKGLSVGGNHAWHDWSQISALTKLQHLHIGETGFSDLSGLQALYSAGAFHGEGEKYLDVSRMQLDLRPGTANRTLIDTFVNAGFVLEDWHNGNATSLAEYGDATITVDGSLSDWSGIPALLTDESGDGDPSTYDVTAVSVSVFDDKLAFRANFVTAGGVANGSQGNLELNLRPLNTGTNYKFFLNEHDDGTYSVSTATTHWDRLTRQETEWTDGPEGLASAFSGATVEFTVNNPGIPSGLYRCWFDTNIGTGDDWHDVDHADQDTFYIEVP